MDPVTFIALALFLAMVVCWVVLPGTATGVVDQDVQVPLGSVQQNI